jgi:hypothetical protein
MVWPGSSMTFFIDAFFSQGTFFGILSLDVSLFGKEVGSDSKVGFLFPTYNVKTRKQRHHKILLCHGNKLLLWPLLVGGGGIRGILYPV